MSTPREFYVNEDKFNDTLGLDYVALSTEMRKFKGIHVIEKTPEVVRKLELFDELVKALEFYADKSNWHTAYCVADEMVFNRDDADFKDQENEYLGKVGGKLARETLKKAKCE